MESKWISLLVKLWMTLGTGAIAYVVTDILFNKPSLSWQSFAVAFIMNGVVNAMLWFSEQK